MATTTAITLFIQVIKDLLPEGVKRFIPFFSMVLWIIWFYFLWEWADYKDLVVQGITVGLASTGLYEWVKWVTKNEEEIYPDGE